MAWQAERKNKPLLPAPILALLAPAGKRKTLVPDDTQARGDGFACTVRRRPWRSGPCGAPPAQADAGAVLRGLRIGCLPEVEQKTVTTATVWNAGEVGVFEGHPLGQELGTDGAGAAWHGWDDAREAWTAAVKWPMIAATP